MYGNVCDLLARENMTFIALLHFYQKTYYLSHYTSRGMWGFSSAVQERNSNFEHMGSLLENVNFSSDEFSPVHVRQLKSNQKQNSPHFT